MAHWLMKSEPDKYAWEDLVRDGRTIWDGVRNHTAAINLRTMQVGDTAFFYHSNEGKAIVGVMRIVRAHHLDPKDATGRFPAVDVVPVEPLARAVTLAEIKADLAFADMALVRQSRLSVGPVSAAEWSRVLAMSRK